MPRRGSRGERGKPSEACRLTARAMRRESRVESQGSRVKGRESRVDGRGSMVEGSKALARNLERHEDAMNFTLLAENPLFMATGVLYAGAFAAYAAIWRSRKALLGLLATALMLAALSGNLGLIVARWIAADRPPFKSLYESMVFLALN